ncbi:hypothetical protein [Streptomyces huiliensis]|uniref:hypothetical protein n=1 Tax=Streptomyces huiliensis TaxID=2876027 RepID=UPI001CBD8980|nr:hypothetical protein [Streptomyces huiliensis]MBZ4320517.1 hypothetical protein [Streptomyces huiliensis]
MDNIAPRAVLAVKLDGTVCEKHVLPALRTSVWDHLELLVPVAAGQKLAYELALRHAETHHRVLWLPVGKPC